MISQFLSQREEFKKISGIIEHLPYDINPKAFLGVLCKEIREVSYFSVLSKGRTGEQWIDFFKERDIDVCSDVVNKVFKIFTPSCDVETVVAVLKGTSLKEVDRRNLVRPSPEVAFLIYEKLLDGGKTLKTLGLDGVDIFPEPVNDPDDGDKMFAIGFTCPDYHYLTMWNDETYRRDRRHSYKPNYGFAFACPPTINNKPYSPSLGDIAAMIECR